MTLPCMSVNILITGFLKFINVCRAVSTVGHCTVGDKHTTVSGFVNFSPVYESKNSNLSLMGAIRSLIDTLHYMGRRGISSMFSFFTTSEIALVDSRVHIIACEFIQRLSS